MKNTIYKIISFFLILSFALSLYSCDSGEDIVKTGIEISNDTNAEYSDSAVTEATGVIYSLLEAYYKIAVMQSIPTATVKKLEDISAQIQKLTEGIGLSETQYNAFIDILRENGKEAATEIANAKKGNAADGGYSKCKALYIELSQALGAEQVGGLLYDLCVFAYEYNHNEKLEDYEKYGYQYILDEAEELKKDKIILVSDIGKANFITVTKAGFICSDLLLGGAFEDERVQGFSDEEILIFLQHIKISDITVSIDGWSLLLSFFITDSVSDDSSYISKLLFAMNENNELDEIASVMNDAVLLLASVQASLSDSDAALLREGRYEEFLESAFSKFTDVEWELFEKITTLNINASAYEAVAEEHFGEDFTLYAENVNKVDLNTLKNSIGTDKFLGSLEGYIAGISAAFSYMVNI